MPFQQAFLLILAGILIAFGLYYFMHSLFVERVRGRYFYFPISALFAGLYLIFECQLTMPGQPETHLLFHKLKIISVLFILTAWFFCIHAMFGIGQVLSRFYLLFSMTLLIFIPTELFLQYPIDHRTITIAGLEFHFYFSTSGPAYTAFALVTMGSFIWSVVNVFRSRLTASDKVFGLFALMPGMIGAPNDFLVTHGLIDMPMISEYMFFTFISATHIRFLHESHRMVEELRQARTALLEQTRFQKELEIAGHIQTSILPNLSSPGCYDIAARMLPAEWAGGDYYDYEQTPDGRHWFCIGDVSGHGLTPGLVMLMAQSAFTTALHMTPWVSIPEILERMNRTLYFNVHNRLKSDLYMTCAIFAADDKGRFRHAGAHLSPIIYRHRLHSIEQPPLEGVWLGIVPEVSDLCPEYPFELWANDCLILYTDGCTENRNSQGDLFGTDRLSAAVLRHADKPVQQMLDDVLGEILAFCSTQNDDITLYIIRYKPAN